MKMKKKRKILSDGLGRGKLKVFNWYLSQGEYALLRKDFDMATAYFGHALAVARIMVRPKTRFVHAVLIRAVIGIARCFREMGHHKSVLNCLESIADLFKYDKNYPDKEELLRMYINSANLCEIFRQKKFCQSFF